MKIKICLIALILGMSVLGFSQTKIGVVDTEYILGKMAEYQSAQNTLEDLAIEWQQEIEEIFAEIEKLYKTYQAEAVLLPEDMKIKRQDEIIKKEKEAKELQKKRFGTNGELFQKRQELIKPIQDKVYNAIEEFANDGNYALILDRSGSAQVLFANPKLECSDDILKKIGY